MGGILSVSVNLPQRVDNGDGSQNLANVNMAEKKPDVVQDANLIVSESNLIEKSSGEIKGSALNPVSDKSLKETNNLVKPEKNVEPPTGVEAKQAVSDMQTVEMQGDKLADAIAKWLKEGYTVTLRYSSGVTEKIVAQDTQNPLRFETENGRSHTFNPTEYYLVSNAPDIKPAPNKEIVITVQSKASQRRNVDNGSIGEFGNRLVDGLLLDTGNKEMEAQKKGLGQENVRPGKSQTQKIDVKRLGNLNKLQESKQDVLHEQPLKANPNPELNIINTGNRVEVPRKTSQPSQDIPEEVPDQKDVQVQKEVREEVQAQKEVLVQKEVREEVQVQKEAPVQNQPVSKKRSDEQCVERAAIFLAKCADKSESPIRQMLNDNYAAAKGEEKKQFGKLLGKWDDFITKSGFNKQAIDNFYLAAPQDKKLVSTCDVYMNAVLTNQDKLVQVKDANGAKRLLSTVLEFVMNVNKDSNGIHFKATASLAEQTRKTL